MRQSRSFEYQNLEEVTKWDSRSEVPGEDGGGGIPNAMGVRRKMAARHSGRDGRLEEMAAGDFRTQGVSEGNGCGRIPDTRGIRRKRRRGIFRTQGASGGKWQWGIPDVMGVRRKMAAGDSGREGVQRKWRRGVSGYKGVRRK